MLFPQKAEQSPVEVALSALPSLKGVPVEIVARILKAHFKNERRVGRVVSPGLGYGLIQVVNIAPLKVIHALS